MRFNENTKLDKTIREIFCDNYIIPLYQRNFAWKKHEIQLLLQDLYESYCEYKVDNSIHYYLGTLVCLYDFQKNVYEVIDGQQRLTVLTLLSKVLQFSECSRICYESRPEVERFFEKLFKLSDCNIANYDKKIKEFANAVELDNFAEALNAFYESNIDAKSEQIYTIPDMGSEREDFKNFILNNVILLRTNLPADTDVASYFEIMNNRGEQLKKTDVMKAQMMNKIKNSETGEYDKNNQKRFSIVWNACSDMNVPIQKFFSKKDKEILFGKDYQSVIALGVESINIDNNNDKCDEKTLEKILQENTDNGTSDIKANNDDEDVDDSKYSSIIDFPNFLMHVIQLYCKQKGIILSNFSLDEKQLLDEFKEMQQQTSFDSMEFVKYLLFYRTCFDRFIIMQKNESFVDENDFNWCLIRPVYKQNSNDNKKFNFYYKRTFVFEENDSEKSKNEELLTDKVIKILSMLQVTFRNKKNKKWVYDILSNEIFKYSESKKLSDLSGEEYLKLLRNKVYNIYLDLKNQNLDKGGTGIHHFIFNYIDYLYWISSDENKTDLLNDNSNLIKEIKLIKNNNKYNFAFKYYSSVEHHYAQNYLAENLQKEIDNQDRIEAEKVKDCINSIGNLILISKKANSRLSDVSPREKVQKRSDKTNLGPNRYIIYKKTVIEDKDVWNSASICEHEKCVKDLLSKSEEILDIK